MTRTGKIARLPNHIREIVNRRLHDGHPGRDILLWLNSLPEVAALVDARFLGNFVTPSNLSQWKNGGYRDWLVRQDALDLFRDAAKLLFSAALPPATPLPATSSAGSPSTMPPPPPAALPPRTTT